MNRKYLSIIADLISYHPNCGRINYWDGDALTTLINKGVVEETEDFYHRKIYKLTSKGFLLYEALDDVVNLVVR